MASAYDDLNTLIHDADLRRFSIDHEQRRITLEFRTDSGHEGSVVFENFAFCSFRNTVVGCIIYDIDVVSMFDLIMENIEEIRDYPLPVAAKDPTEMAEQIIAKGFQAFYLCSSYGMSGWIVARNLELMNENSA